MLKCHFILLMKMAKKSVWINAYIYRNMNQFLASIGLSLILVVDGHYVCM